MDDIKCYARLKYSKVVYLIHEGRPYHHFFLLSSQLHPQYTIGGTVKGITSVVDQLVGFVIRKPQLFRICNSCYCVRKKMK